MAKRRKQQNQEPSKEVEVVAQMNHSHLGQDTVAPVAGASKSVERRVSKAVAGDAASLVIQMGLNPANWREKWAEKFKAQITSDRPNLNKLASLLSQDAVNCRIPVNSEQIETRTEVEIIPFTVCGFKIWIPRGGTGVTVPESVYTHILESGHVDGNEMRMHMNGVRASMGKRRVADARRA